MQCVGLSCWALGAGRLAVTGAEFARGSGITVEVFGGPRQADTRLPDGRSVADVLAALGAALRYVESIRDCAGGPYDGPADGAGGMSLLGRLCCGVASIVITQAENQAQNAEGAERLGAAVCAGSAGELDLEAVSALIVEFAAGGGRRARLQAAGLALVDGLGARRAAQSLRGIYEAFCESQISL